MTTSSSSVNNVVPIALLSALVGAYVYQQCVSSSQETPATKEEFVNHQFQSVVDTVHVQNGKHYSTANNNQRVLSNLPDLNVIQCPGQYQTSPPPRMSSVSIGAAINWNPPPKSQMALDTQNPLPWAQTIEKVHTSPQSSSAPRQTALREAFEYGSDAKTSAEYQGMQNELGKTGDLYSVDTLPSPKEPPSHGLPQPASMTTTSIETDTKEPTINYERLLVANLSRLRGNSDYIRGDLAIAPIRPVLDPCSHTWFRPSSDPSGLNSGALAALGGAFASDMREVVQLKMANSGGGNNAQAGTTWTIPQSTAIGQKLYNMSTTDNTMGTGGPFGDVTNQRVGPDLSNYTTQRLPY